jgi:hypothetical protein
MQLSKEQLEDFKKIWKKEYGEDLSDKKTYEYASSLARFVEILYKQAKIDYARKEQLKKEPKGFHLEGGPYNCFICHDSISNKETWYDKYGIKCLNCQKAQEKKIIPVSAVKNRDSWLVSWELNDKFGLHYQTINKLIREGKLKPRTILDKNGNIHYQIFLIKKNEKFLKQQKKNK